jgi:hypothetical protein
MKCDQKNTKIWKTSHIISDHSGIKWNQWQKKLCEIYEHMKTEWYAFELLVCHCKNEWNNSENSYKKIKIHLTRTLGDVSKSVLRRKFVTTITCIKK